MKMRLNTQPGVADRVWNSRISKRRKKCHAESEIELRAAHSWPDVLQARGYDVAFAPEDSKYLPTQVFSGFVAFPAFELFVDVEVVYDRGLVADVVEGKYAADHEYHHRYRLYLLTDRDTDDDVAAGPARDVLHLIAEIQGVDALEDQRPCD